MPTINLNLPHHSYQIQIEPGLLARLGTLVKAVAPHPHAALLADEITFKHHGPAAQRSLETAGYQILLHPVPIGEENKNLDTVRKLYDALLNARLERSSPILALGGGVTGDTVGFVAATYLRGTPFIQVPTTLLAMVDASVGGKVGVNVPQGKNLIGAFYQPKLVVIDPQTLSTLPPRELRCGLAECVKHAVICDPDLFAWTEKNIDSILNLDPDTLTELIARNVQIKADVVMADEKETGKRAHLNLGHTFAHAIEAATPNFSSSINNPAAAHSYHHGEAVALGMIAATRLAIDLHRCDQSVLNSLLNLFNRIGLPTHAANLPPTDALLDLMQMDKKVSAGKLRFVLPDRIGSVAIVSDVPADSISAAWQSIRQ